MPDSLRASGPPLLNVSPSRRSRGIVAMAAQARTAEQDRGSQTRYACSKCDITYYVQARQKPKCPLCDAQRRVVELQRAMGTMRNQVETLENANHRLQAGLDISTAMSDALAITDSDDLIFLKSVLYRYRADNGSIQLRVTHGPATRKKGRPPANGLMAVPREGEPEAHICTSVGGVAIAGYFEQALRMAGGPTAMATIMRALNRILAATEREPGV